MLISSYLKCTTLAATLAFVPSFIAAQTAFAPPTDFTGRMQISSTDDGAPIFPGSRVSLRGSGYTPGQSIVLQRGTQVLTQTPLLVDAQGAVAFELSLPDDAAVGMHPVVMLGQTPDATQILDLKVSPVVALQGGDRFDQMAVTSPVAGLYQLDYSAKSGAVFVTASAFTPPQSALMKLDPTTLQVLARTDPAPFTAALKSGKGGRFADGPVGVFGIGLDDSRDRVWVTNTPANSLAVYDSNDLSLIKQFPQDEVYHSREVLVDEANGRVYVTSSATAKVYVFDAQTLEPVKIIEIDSTLRGEDFYVMNMALDATGGRIFVSSRATSEVAVIDTTLGEVTQVFAVPDMIHATGIAYGDGRLFVAGQGSDNLAIIDPADTNVLYNVPVGAGALSVVYDDTNGRAWVANRGAGTLTGVDAEGKIVAVLDIGSLPNDVAIGPDGALYTTNKSRGAQDATGDRITVIRAK
ncbi:hypothetical protein BFP70_09150 [Thioclava sp. SK-1]|uniref:YncE family protein n=1 Tax=Thioclava sp. SK-1 TaxID=1889770 RepID=UPI0008263D17|nr:hypothetical protein [Thioclava sp. SK-1]OCX65642.1 hypothetical protein BFP70_09150 [Thioclava sp. SK-1]